MKKFYFWGLLLFVSITKLASQVFFQNVAAPKGIQHSFGVAVPGGGVSFCDFNQDGWDDLTLGTIEGENIHFYMNRQGIFLKIPPLVPHTGNSEQILWVDYDNDGDKDLFVATFGGVNRLYQNLGDLQLMDVTETAGLPLESFDTYGACFGDFDRDGWLDLYLGRRTGTPSQNTHLLFRNNADGTFTEMAVAAGASDPQKIPFCSAFFDYNNDDWPDIYTANDRFTGNTLLKNNGDGTFSDVGNDAGADLKMNAMTVTIGDYNNDGWLDIYSTNTEVGNRLLRNNGDGTFTEVADYAGVVFGSIGWGAQFFDADNDGWEDLYVSGMVPRSTVNSSAFYYNQQDGTFSQPDAGFVGDTVSSFNNAFGDFNRDGRLDLMVVNTTPFQSQLWENGSITENNWVKLILRGVLSNRDGIGSRVELYTKDLRQTRFTACGMGFLGQNSETIQFGVGTTDFIDSIIIRWPTGHEDKLYDIAVGQYLHIVEGSTTNGQINVDPGLNLTTASQEIKPHIENISIFPNPVSNRLFFNVNTPQNSDLQVTISDITGRLVFSSQIVSFAHAIEISTNNLTAGIYLLQVNEINGKKSYIGKFLKK